MCANVAVGCGCLVAMFMFSFCCFNGFGAWFICCAWVVWRWVGFSKKVFSYLFKCIYFLFGGLLLWKAKLSKVFILKRFKTKLKIYGKFFVLLLFQRKCWKISAHNNLVRKLKEKLYINWYNQKLYLLSLSIFACAFFSLGKWCWGQNGS